jgi:hypothetical protein
MACLGVVQCSLSSPNTLERSSCFVSLAPARLAWEVRASSQRQESFPHRSALLHLIFSKETMGAPTFPSYPSEGMPRSQTPVVSCTLALSRPGLLPSGHCTPSAFPRYGLEDYPIDHD